MCPIKPVKHYFLTWAGVAEWVTSKMDIRTARVRVSSATKRFRQMHEKKNIFYTVLVQNIENGKLQRQVDSVHAGLNRESKSHVFFSVRSLYCINEFPKKNYSCWEWLSFYYYQVYNNQRRYRRRPAMTHDQLTANNRRRLFGIYSWPAAGDIYAHTTSNWVIIADLWAWHRTGGRIAYLTPIIASIGHERL